MNIDELKSVARAIVAEQKGILAADESNPTIKKRFDAIKLASSEESRRRYRELLFTTEGVERYLGGVILYDETLRQSTADGIPFAALLSSRGIIPGIKVDQGTKTLALHPGEKSAGHTNRLRTRCASRSTTATFQARTASMPMSTAWRVTPRCARKPALCRSWSRKY